MKAVLFMETKKGEILFKCDTFWSQSDKPSNAKVHSDDSYQDLKRWLQAVLPSNIYTDKVQHVIDKYDGGKLGYFTPNEDLFESNFSLKKDVDVSQLGKPTYMWVIKLRDFSEWNCKANKYDSDRKSIDVNDIGEFIDYRVEHRDEILSDILNEKESE